MYGELNFNPMLMMNQIKYIAIPLIAFFLILAIIIATISHIRK